MNQSHLSLGQPMSGELDDGEVALADGFLNVVKADADGGTFVDHATASDTTATAAAAAH